MSAPDTFFGGKTGTLGWAMGAAVGVQLAWPERAVVATIGDGSIMYAPQALWTAARYRLPITYVVANNTSYAILKSGMVTLGLPSAKRGVFPGMDLVDPNRLRGTRSGDGRMRCASTPPRCATRSRSVWRPGAGPRRRRDRPSFEPMM